MLFEDMYMLNPTLCVHIMDMKLLLFLLEFQSVHAVLAVRYLLDDTCMLSTVLRRPLMFIKHITVKLSLSSHNPRRHCHYNPMYVSSTVLHSIEKYKN